MSIRLAPRRAVRRPLRFADQVDDSGLLAIVDDLSGDLEASVMLAQAALLPDDDHGIWKLSNADIFVGLLVWGLYHDRIVTALTPTLTTAVLRAQDTTGPGYQDSVQAAAQVQTQATLLATRIVNETRDGLRDVLQQGIADGLSGAALAARIRPLVGLTLRQAQAVVKYREGLLATGMSPGRAMQLANAYALRAQSVRAATIAQTELVKAVNAGQDLAWAAMQHNGTLAHDQLQEWMVEFDNRLCERCAPLAGQRVPVGTPFITDDGEAVDAPPLHPRCRCERRLVDMSADEAST